MELEAVFRFSMTEEIIFGQLLLATSKAIEALLLECETSTSSQRCFRTVQHAVSYLCLGQAAKTFYWAALSFSTSAEYPLKASADCLA